MLGGQQMPSPCCLPCNKVDQGLMALGLPALHEAVEHTMHADLLTVDLMLTLQDVIAEVTQHMLELNEARKHVRAHPTKKHICSCCSMQ